MLTRFKSVQQDFVHFYVNAFFTRYLSAASLYLILSGFRHAHFIIVLAEVIVLERAGSPCFRRFWRSKSRAVFTLKTDTHVQRSRWIWLHAVRNQAAVISQTLFSSMHAHYDSLENSSKYFIKIFKGRFIYLIRAHYWNCDLSEHYKPKGQYL